MLTRQHLLKHKISQSISHLLKSTREISPKGYSVVSWVFHFFYVLCRWQRFILDLHELSSFRRSKLGESHLNKVWKGSGSNFKNPVFIDILKVQKILPSILPDYFHYNPTLQVNNSHLNLFWRVSSNTLPINFDKRGDSSNIAQERFYEENFERIISGNLDLDLDLDLDIVTPSSQIVFDQLVIGNYHEIVDDLDIPDKSIFLEDPRAHRENGRYITAIARVGTIKSDWRGITRMVLIDIQEACAKIISSDNDRRVEKNWVVIQEYENSLIMLQHSNPQVIVNVDKKSGYAETVSGNPDNFIAEPNNVNGGSPFVLVDNSFYLRVARRQFISGSRVGVRLNLLVKHDLQLREVSRSTPFVFQELGVEICNGLALDGDRFYFTWGKNDREMYIGTCNKNDLLGWYETHKQR